MNMVCVKCELSLKVVKIGVRVCEMFGPAEGPEPYQIWQCDIFKCPQCGIEICGSFGSSPIAQHWQPDFAEYLIAGMIHDYGRSGPWTPSWRG